MRSTFIVTESQEERTATNKVENLVFNPKFLIYNLQFIMSKSVLKIEKV